MTFLQKKHNPLRPNGFTLLEIITVLALIALIAGVAISNVDKFFSGGQSKSAKLWVDNIETPLTAYRIDVGSYPSTEEGLKALISCPPNKESRWKGPYVKKLPDDPWGHPYQYKFPGSKNPDRFDVFSFGPDGTESPDDIGNWDSAK